MNTERDERKSQEIHYKGYLYYTGTNGFTKDYKKAFELFSEAATQFNNIESINCLGLMYMDGLYVKQDFFRAINYFKRALTIDPNFGRASYNLGRVYIIGASSIPINLKLAESYFSVAIANGKGEAFYAYACHFMGYVLIELGKRKEAVSYVLEAVNKNGKIAEAWYNLGLLTEYKVFRSKYSERNCWWYYRKAAELGYSHAMYIVAKEYYEEYQFEEDFDIAIRCLEKANMWKQKAIDAGYDLAKRLHKPHRITGPAYENRHTTPKDSGTMKTYSSNYSNFSVPEQKEPQESEKHFVFYDGKGNYTESGHCFYDFKGNYVEWGAPFYDARGNYCEWGAPFYDSRGNYITWGSPFYDSKGNYIVP